MRDTFDRIREHCGEVCDTTVGPSGRGKYFDVVEKHIDCDKLFSDDFVEGWAQSIEAKPPILESLVCTGMASVLQGVRQSVSFFDTPLISGMG